jgi:predicted  nucleic acid-binding Zn-ribbon protein
MWSSTLPTRTVRNEGRSRRTFPQQSASKPDSRPRQPRQSDPVSDRSQAALREEVDKLRTEKQQAEAEIQQLQSEVDRLQGQLADRQQSQQAMIDQYEAIIAELEAAAATTPTTKPAAGKQGLLGRLKRELF